MGGQYQLDTDRMQTTGTTLGSNADELANSLVQFNNTVSNLLADGYRTPTSSQAFSDSWEQFKKGYQQVVDGLHGMGQFLGSAGSAFDGTDQQLGKAIKG